MVSHTAVTNISHKNKNTDYHKDWVFRREAVVWRDDNTPLAPNLYPLATELRKWLLPKGTLRFFSSEDKLLPETYSNPYTFDGSILSIAYGQIVNDSSAFSKSKDSTNPNEVEVRRIRLYSENVLYTARLSEAFIKQLLYCTSFKERDYRGAALGSLLSKDCGACRNAKQKHHRTSLLGSLAHRYQLCHTYDRCLDEHIRMVNRRRDLEAAHSGVVGFSDKGESATRKQADSDLTAIGNDFLHLLQHIGELEGRMLSELEAGITSANCPVVKVIRKRHQPQVG
jgi:hypothetical protein